VEAGREWGARERRRDRAEKRGNHGFGNGGCGNGGCGNGGCGNDGCGNGGCGNDGCGNDGCGNGGCGKGGCGKGDGGRRRERCGSRTFEYGPSAFAFLDWLSRPYYQTAGDA